MEGRLSYLELPFVLVVFTVRTEKMNTIIIPITLFSKIIGICSLEMVMSLGE